MLKIIAQASLILSKENKNLFFKIIILNTFKSIFEFFTIALFFPLIFLILKKQEISLPYVKLNLDFIGQFYLCIFIIFLLNIIKFFYLKWLNSFTFKYISNLQQEISNVVYSFFLYENYSNTLNENSSINLRKIAQDPIFFSSSVLKSSLNLYSEVLFSVLILIFLIFIDYNIALFAIASSLIILLIYKLIFKKQLVKYGEEKYEMDKKKFKFVTETLNGLRDIINYDLRNISKEIFGKINSGYTKTFFHINKVQLLPSIFFEFILLSLGLLLIIFLFVINEKNLILNLSIYFLSIIKILPTINRFVTNIQSIQSNIPSIKNLNEIYKNINEKKNILKNYSNKLEFKKNLIISNLNFSYHNKTKKILNNLNFEISVGDIIGIKGSSGCGKSTFLDILSGLLPVSDIKLQLDNCNIKPDQLIDLRYLIGYVSQRSFIFNDTIQKNIVLNFNSKNFNIPNFRKSVECVNLLESLNINNIIELDNITIGQFGKDLSGGQAQRIGIARALFNKSKLIIFDESTNALDQESENRIMNNIIKNYKDLTMIIVSHNTDIFKFCNKVYLMKNGRFFIE